MSDGENADLGMATHLQFRLLLVQRHELQIEQEVVFYSRREPLAMRGKVWS
jgi:hypothetical protein